MRALFCAVSWAWLLGFSYRCLNSVGIQYTMVTTKGAYHVVERAMQKLNRKLETAEQGSRVGHLGHSFGQDLSKALPREPL